MINKGPKWYLGAATEYQRLSAQSYATAMRARENGELKFCRFAMSRAASYSKQARANLFLALGVEGENDPA